MILRLIILIGLITLSCSKDEALYVPTQKTDPYETYREGLRAFQENQFFLLVKNLLMQR